LSRPESRATKLGESDRERYLEEVGSIMQTLAGGAPDETAVWEAYARLEKLIAVLRFRIDYETPGVFARLPDATDKTRLLSEARRLLSKSRDELGAGRSVGCVEALREARNDLRSFLRETKLSSRRKRSSVRTGQA